MYISGIDPTVVYTSTDVFPFKPGQIGFNEGGLKGYMFVTADEALTAGNAVLVHEDYGSEQVDTTSAAAGTGSGLPAGLCVTSIASGGAGWIQVYGTGDTSLNVASSSAAHTTLVATSTAGRLDDAATGIVIAGITQTAAESSNAAACILHWPFVSLTLS